MGADSGKDNSVLIGEIKSSLQKTQKVVAVRKRTNSRLLLAGMAFSGASTLVAGITSAGGPIVGSGIEGWRVACILAAIFGFSATISTGVLQQRESTDQLAKGKECLSKLRSLDLVINSGKNDWEETVKKYDELTINYPELIN